MKIHPFELMVVRLGQCEMRKSLYGPRNTVSTVGKEILAEKMELAMRSTCNSSMLRWTVLRFGHTTRVSHNLVPKEAGGEGRISL
jgi:hypothetical protein